MRHREQTALPVRLKTIVESTIPKAMPVSVLVSMLLFVWQVSYVLARPDATITEFPTITSNSIPNGITEGPDGAMWFTEYNSDRIGRITMGGTVTEFEVSEPNRPLELGDIALGSDGNLWFTEAKYNRPMIGRITPAGAVEEWPVIDQPVRITSGPDDALWFTLSSESQIGRISTTGERTYYPLPDYLHAYDITAGPNNSQTLWFTVPGTIQNRIGRMTLDGGVFTWNTADSVNVHSITAGPDGNLWFTMSDAVKIGSISPSGLMHEFPLPQGSSSPQDITAGPDGKLWFTLAEGVGSIFVGGDIQIYDPPNSHEKNRGIAAGPDGTDTVWFAEGGSSLIGRISDLSGPPPPTATTTAIATATTAATTTPQPSPTPLSEGFESGTLGEVFFSEGNPGWRAVNTVSHTGSWSAFAPDVADVAMQCMVLRDPIVVPANATTPSTFAFWHRYSFEYDNNGFYDGAVLEASTDGGATWQDAEPNILSNGYRGVISSQYGNPLGGRSAWVGSTGGEFVQVEVDLRPYAGRSVIFRLCEGTDESNAGEGWWIDDVLVTISTASGCQLPFSDVSSGSTFYPYVQCLAGRGLIGGYSDCTFRPNNDVTRGQLSKIVSNSAGFNDPPGAQLFQDVAPGSPFYDWVQRLALRGYIGGYPCGGVGEPCVAPGNRPYFRPGANATRGQISKIVANAAGFDDDPTGQLFEDVAPGSSFYTWVQRLASRGIMGGYPCGGENEPCGTDNRPYFRPFNNATRGQTSKIVSNTFFPNNCQP